MKQTLCLMVSVLLLNSWAWAKNNLEAPRVDNKTKTVTLGKDVSQALKQWNKNFKLNELEDFMEPVTYLFEVSNQELPMAVQGDFNGDDISDVALMGHANGRQYFIMVVSNEAKNKYEVHEIRRSALMDPKKSTHKIDGDDYKGLNTYLSLLPAKMIAKTPDAKKRKVSSSDNSKKDGVQIEIYRSEATEAFIFDGKKVVPFTGELIH